jgi:hypothetical protein
VIVDLENLVENGGIYVVGVLNSRKSSSSSNSGPFFNQNIISSSLTRNISLLRMLLSDFHIHTRYSDEYERLGFVLYAGLLLPCGFSAILS